MGGSKVGQDEMGGRWTSTHVYFVRIIYNHRRYWDISDEKEGWEFS